MKSCAHRLIFLTRRHVNFQIFVENEVWWRYEIPLRSNFEPSQFQRIPFINSIHFQRTMKKLLRNILEIALEKKLQLVFECPYIFEHTYLYLKNLFDSKSWRIQRSVSSKLRRNGWISTKTSVSFCNLWWLRHESSAKRKVHLWLWKSRIFRNSDLFLLWSLISPHYELTLHIS